MASDIERQAAGATVARYEALILVSGALRSYHDRETLFRSLARELRPVVHFSFLGLALYDERTEVVEPYVLQSTGEPGPLPPLTSDDQLTYWVLRHKTPLVVDAVAHETRFAQEMEYLRNQDTQSICCLPLITPQRRVGMLIAGSREAHKYGGADVAFLSLVANQVALAVDDTLNFGALQAALALERERLQNLEASDELLRTSLSKRAQSTTLTALHVESTTYEGETIGLLPIVIGPPMCCDHLRALASIFAPVTAGRTPRERQASIGPPNHGRHAGRVTRVAAHASPQ